MSLGKTISRNCVGHLDLSEYVAVDAAAPVRDVVELMRGENRTTTLVLRDDRLAGIFTERDVLRKVALRDGALDLPVGELMTPDPVVAAADLSIRGALRLMKEGHFLDLPVVGASGKLLGNLTDNSIVRHLADHLQAEVLNLPPDPAQVPEKEEGA
jgi:CBS domain-containing protein